MALDIHFLSKLSDTSLELSTKSSSYIPSICSFRRATDSDMEEIIAIMATNAEEVFGYTHPGYLIKKCYFSLVAVTALGTIAALICLDDRPNIKALPAGEWETWIQRLYNLEGITSQNTLWIHYMASDQNYMYTFAKPLLEQVFLSFPFLDNVIAVMPGHVPIYCYFEENFTCILPVGYKNPRKVQTLYLTTRNQYLKKYKIRLAVEEDNDDIVEIVDIHSKKLKEMYGEYYVSEILTKFTDMDRHIIVAELAERAVAALFLNGYVDYKSLQESFHLEPFGNLYYLDDNFTVQHQQVCVMAPLEPKTSQCVWPSFIQYTPSVESITPSPEGKNHQEENISLSEIFDLENLGLFYDEIYGVDVVRVDSSKLEVEEIGETSSPSLSIHTPICRSTVELTVSPQIESAFTVEVMAAGDEHETACVCDLLEATFQKFPERPYCVFAVEHNQPHFPLFSYFTRAIPKNRAIYPQEIYILHKNSVRAHLEVRKLSKKDFNQIKTFITTTKFATVILDAVTKSLYSSTHNTKTYIMLNESIIVGLIIVSEEDDLDVYFENYTLYQYVDKAVHRYNKFGSIEFCVLSVIFEKHLQFFLREVHRISDMSILIYKLTKNEAINRGSTKPLPAVLRDMIPLADRNLGFFANMELTEVEIPKCLQSCKEDMYALLLSTRRLCSLPRIDINSRIVVVGTSHTALSFLEALIFTFDEQKHTIFNNLYLIYDRPVQDQRGVTKNIPNMFLYRGKYTGNHFSSVCFNLHVNYVNGTMTAINRKLKYITVNKQFIQPYDYLFLMCGQQYHHPYAQGIRRDRVVAPCPENVFVINNYSDGEFAFNKISEYLVERKCPTIIIYGSSFHAYCCITALEKSHFPLNKVKFIEPLPDEYERPSVDPFNNPLIHECFHDLLFMLGIEVHIGYYFYEWVLDQTKKHVTKVKYQSRKGIITLKCDFVFHYANKEVSYDTFTAVNSAGLVYDGKLVIKPDCRTNDPFIFAAGPMTKYSRRYFADRYVHKYYNSHEIGTKLGKQVRAMLLPGGLEENEGEAIFEMLKTPETDKLVPHYTDPHILYCQLPGRINYLDIHSPGKPVPLESQKHIGHIFETGKIKDLDLDTDPCYFRLQLDQHNKVEQIVCFTRIEIDVYNLQQIWGKHEKVLNNLIIRYRRGMITDFYDYFRTPYFCAIYLDRFIDLHWNMISILTVLKATEEQSIIEDILEELLKNNWKPLSTDQENLIKQKFINSNIQKQMVQEVMEFIGKNFKYLPMYAHPLVTKYLIYDVEQSPLFQKPPDDLDFDDDDVN